MWYQYGYAYGWWWWWIAFVIIFFLLPLGYGWGYRGWGPWYRRGPPGGRHLRAGEPNARLGPAGPIDTGWGWLGIVLWLILLIAILWAIGAWSWGYR